VNIPHAEVKEFRVHVFRAGESLAGIAADLGLNADQLARANGLASTDVVAEGVLLVIPAGPPFRATSRNTAQRRADRSG
jgi:LysM repeat protein